MDVPEPKSLAVPDSRLNSADAEGAIAAAVVIDESFRDKLRTRQGRRIEVFLSS